MLNPDFKDMLSALCGEGVEFLIVGAYALAAHGRPRATGDLDIWVDCTHENAQHVWRALQRFGAPLQGMTAEDLTTPGVEFRDAWPHRITIAVEDLRIPVIGRAHLIQNKKAVRRPQDLADAAWLESSPTT